MYYAFGGKGYATATYEIIVCEPIDSIMPVPEIVEVVTLNDELNEVKRQHEELNNQIKTKDEEIKNLNTEVFLLREKLLEKIYLISELHTKLNECES